MSRRLLLLVACLCVALVVGAAAPARADDPPPGGTTQTPPVYASGPIVALSVDSITVGSLRCSVPAEKLASFTALHLAVGQLVKIACVASGDHLVLTAIARGDATTTGPQVRSAEGAIAAVSADSITVGRLTCT